MAARKYDQIYVLGAHTCSSMSNVWELTLSWWRVIFLISFKIIGQHMVQNWLFYVVLMIRLRLLLFFSAKATGHLFESASTPPSDLKHFERPLQSTAAQFWAHKRKFKILRSYLSSISFDNIECVLVPLMPKVVLISR